MSSGALTETEKLCLQERTSIFLNIAGIEIQRSRNTFDEGVSSRRLFKVLANAIWDWHWIKTNHPEGAAISGIGDFLWVPNKFGALGLINPQFPWGYIGLEHGLFAHTPDLFQSNVYAQFGFRGTEKKNGRTYFKFSEKAISLEEVKQFAFGLEEYHYWQEIVRVYAIQTDATLDALASCRNHTTFSHSLWIQFVMWRRHAGMLLDLLQERPISALLSDAKGIAKGHLSSASACVAQMAIKQEYWNKRDLFLAEMRKATSHTLFGTFLPCTTEGIVERDQMAHEKLARMVPAIAALHQVIELFCCRLKLTNEGISVGDLKEKLDQIVTIFPEIEGRPKVAQWTTFWLRAEAREISSSLLDTVEKLFEQAEKNTGLRFQRSTKHYESFISNYPLPKAGFRRGF